VSQNYEERADDIDEPRPLAQTANPFGLAVPTAAMVEITKSRESSEVQAAMVLARQFPRDPVRAMDRILNAFQRPTLAEKAMYQYARGGQDITGPSIRAAEAIAIGWGNVQYAVRELEQRNGSSSVEAYAWDVETNTRSARTFFVEHKRHTKKGSYALEDPRDIYELVANNGARRLRACILSVIPGDVVDAAMRQAVTTLKSRVNITPELLSSIVEKFAEHGVTKAQIEQRIQRRFDAITPAQVINLGNVLNSLNDGMSAAVDHFEIPPAAATATAPGMSRAEQMRAQVVPPVAAAAPSAEEAPPTAVDTGEPTADEKLDIVVAEFIESVSAGNPTEILAKVKLLAASRGITDERELAEIYKRATGKLAFTKAGMPQIVREIMQMPIVAQEVVE
jgi:hypothetical protein